MNDYESRQHDSQAALRAAFAVAARFAVCKAVGTRSRQAGCEVGTLGRVSRRSAALASRIAPSRGVKRMMLPCCLCGRGAHKGRVFACRTPRFFSIAKEPRSKKAVTQESRPSSSQFPKKSACTIVEKRDLESRWTDTASGHFC